MVAIQIITDCSVFDRFCFLCVLCLFWWLYGFLWRVIAIEKLEYSRYNAKIEYELVCNTTYSNGLLSCINGSHEGFVEFCVIEVFKFWVKDLMDYGTRSGNSLRLGMPKAPQDNILRSLKHLSLGMPRLASHPSSSTTIR